MLRCVTDLRAKKRLLTKHRRDRQRIREYLQKIEKLATAEYNEIRCSIKLDRAKRIARKALKVLDIDDAYEGTNRGR